MTWDIGILEDGTVYESVEQPETYKIVRFCFDETDPAHRSVVTRGLTLEEAQEHCQKESTHYKDPETGLVVWFDGYERE